jgi:hypothetical protein
MLASVLRSRFANVLRDRPTAFANLQPLKLVYRFGSLFVSKIRPISLVCLEIYLLLVAFHKTMVVFICPSSQFPFPREGQKIGEKVSLQAVAYKLTFF